MGSKGVVIFGIFFMVVLLISSQLLAVRELREEIYKPQDHAHGPISNVGPYPYNPYGGYCPYGCCGYYYGSCQCCRYAGEMADAEVKAKPHN